MKGSETLNPGRPGDPGNPAPSSQREAQATLRVEPLAGSMAGSMSDIQRDAAASALRQAAESHEYIAPLRQRYPGMTIDDAYDIQQRNIARAIAGGARSVGCKIGLTSVAVQKQLGVDQPDFGVLLDTMAYDDDMPIPMRTLHQPKVEAEIAFVMGRDLNEPHASAVDVVRAIDYALPAIEIVGSRIAKWDIKIVDTVADNASASAFVVGTRPVLLSAFDPRLCGMVLERRGEPLSVGAGAACLGNPINAVVWLARTMARRGRPLKAGDLVLSGALGPMAVVNAGDTVEARIQGLGTVRAHFDAPQRQGVPS